MRPGLAVTPTGAVRWRRSGPSGHRGHDHQHDAAPAWVAWLSRLGFKAGLFNIGAQGQFLMGALGAVCVGVHLARQPAAVAVPLALLGGMAAGALVGFHSGPAEGGLGRP